MRRNAKNWTSAITAASLTAILSCGSAYAATGTYTVQSGDTLWLVAHHFHVAVTSLQNANPGVVARNLLIGQVLTLPQGALQDSPAAAGLATAGQRAYTIQSGDTEWNIARRFGVPLSTLQQLNPRLNAQNLPTGGMVTLPAGASASGAAGTTTAASPAGQGQSSVGAAHSANLAWLTRVIAAEAQGQPVNAKLAVGAVVMNRLRAGYGQSVQAVIFQQINGVAQFTSVANGWIYKAQPSAADASIAAQVLGGTDILPSAMVFYNPAQTPAGSWVRQQPVLAAYGSLTFAS